jgi:hypothetical protein
MKRHRQLPRRLANQAVASSGLPMVIRYTASLSGLSPQAAAAAAMRLTGSTESLFAPAA